MKKSFLLFLLSLIPGCLLFGQNQIIPPSPNATSLGQYGDVPVSNYTGVPSISIPLYTIKSGEIELPISLSYHASGIKVAQEASWVGLGWSLNAGGVITRQVNGLDDFDDRGFIGAPELPISGTPMWSCIHNNDPTSIREKLFEYDAGMEDAQPDDFYFNFFGRSGRLIFQKQDGNIIKAIAAEQNNMVFYYDKSTDQWEIIDGKGWRYYFHTTEISRNSSETSNLPIGYPSSNPWSEEITTAWYIDRVETPRGAEINFFYGKTGRWIDEQVNYSQKRYDREIELDVNGESGFVASHVLGNYTNRYSASVSQVNEVYLQRIDFENGYIEFGLSDRQDRITSLNATPSKSLSNIWIYNTDGKMIKQITFSYGYFRVC